MSNYVSNTLKNVCAVIMIAAAGFAGPLWADQAVLEAVPDVIEDCENLGAVNAHSGYGKHVGGHWEKVAKSRALRKADRIGGSHIVWDQVTPRGVFNGHVSGTVYDCDS